MQCYTATRSGVFDGIFFNGDTMWFHDNRVVLSGELKADRSTVTQSGFWRSLLAKTYLVRGCSMQLDDQFGCARLLPPNQNESGLALVLVYLSDIELGSRYEGFRLKGERKRIFSRFNSRRMGSTDGEYWYLIVMDKYSAVIFSEKGAITRQMNPIFTLHFDGEELCHTAHHVPLAFESSSIIG